MSARIALSAVLPSARRSMTPVRALPAPTAAPPKTRPKGLASRITAAAISLLLLAGTGLVIHNQQSRSKQEILERFDLRAQIGAQFLQGYVAELLLHEGQAAVASTSQREFVDVTTTMGFQGAALTDATGHVLRLFPAQSSLIGSDISARFPALKEAMSGHPAVSGVIQTGPGLGSIVQFVVPFPSGGGLRIYSGSLPVSSQSVISSFVRNLSPIKGVSVWLVDADGQTIAANIGVVQTGDVMRRTDPALFTAAASSAGGSYAGPAGASRFAAVSVPGTPWRLIVAGPDSQIFLGVEGFNAAIPWLIFAGLVVAAATVSVLQFKIAKVRERQLEDVERLSVTDPLTDLYNRRGYELLATQVLKDAARDGRSAGLMFFDIDGLKIINDTFGHAVGDEAIKTAATLLRSTFRDSDIIARLGGDEFCVVGALPGRSTDVSAALARLHAAVARHNEREHPPFRLSLSGGLAVWDPASPRSLAELEEEADQRMYAKKPAQLLAQ